MRLFGRPVFPHSRKLNFDLDFIEDNTRVTSNSNRTKAHDFSPRIKFPQERKTFVRPINPGSRLCTITTKRSEQTIQSQKRYFLLKLTQLINFTQSCLGLPIKHNQAGHLYGVYWLFVTIQLNKNKVKDIPSCTCNCSWNVQLRLSPITTKLLSVYSINFHFNTNYWY